MRNDLVQHDVIRLAKKDLANDIFRTINSNTEHNYNDFESLQRKISYRYKERTSATTLKRIEAIISLNLAKKELYLKLILLRISLYKLILI